MWYKVDLVKLVQMLLPPVLRSKVLLALAKVLIEPLRHVYGLFSAQKEETDEKLSMSGTVEVLERALNREFSLTEGEIYIESVEDKSRATYFHKKAEGQEPVTLYKEEEKKPQYTVWSWEVGSTVNFIVMVPTFLCTSLESKEADKCGWANLRTIESVLDTYKPAGRTYNIQLYDYE